LIASVPAHAAAPLPESGALERMLSTVLMIAISVYLGEEVNVP
jgi:hypothetical protein